MRLAVTALALLLAVPAAAQESALFPRFSLTYGSYAGGFDTDVRVDDTTTEAVGTEINLESELGLDDAEQLGRFAVRWRPFNRHELAATYTAARRSGFEAIDREITFEDNTYPVNAEVTTQFDTDLTELTYTYWLRKRERDGFGLTLGVSRIALDASLVATRPGQSVAITNEATTDVPVALIGAQARFAFGSRVLAEVSGATLPRVEIGEYSGRALTGRAAVEVRLFRALGIGAAYNYFRIDGGIEQLDFTGDISMTVRGAEAFVSLGF